MEGLLIGLLVMTVFVVLGSLILGGLSKLTGDKISYRGSIVATPTSLKEQSELIKDGGKKIKEFAVKKSNELIKQIESIRTSKTDKGERIEKLADLKEKNLISEEEFIYLKREIIDER